MEQIVKILKEQGICPIYEEGFLTFSYQNINFLYLEDERDKTFYSLYIPGILKVDHTCKCDVLEVTNAINNELKIVKLILNGEYVWAGMEQRLSSETDLKKMIFFSIDVLVLAYELFHTKWVHGRALN
jgi:hypothetical protein